MGLYHALLGYLVVRGRLQRGPLGWLVGLPFAWILMEWWRGWFLTGFPWLSLGYSQTDTWLGALAPVLGVYGISLAVAMVTGGLMALLLGRRHEKILGAAVIVLIWSAAAMLGRVQWTADAGDELSITLVQASIPQEQKWLPAMLKPTQDLYVSLTDGHWDSDLVIWPEAAIPALIDEVDDYLMALRKRMLEQGNTLLLGIIDFEPDTGAYRNTLLSLGPQVELYYKRHLVPFGEFFPVPEFVRRWMRLKNLPYTDFKAGRYDQPPLQVNGFLVAPSICYEDAYGTEQRVFFPAAALLVNVSNDAWFGDTIAPHQHLQISRMRAMEVRRFMLRATNNGISAVIGSRGELLEVSQQFVPAVIDATIQPLSGETAYVRFGNWPLLVTGLITLIALLLYRQNWRSR
ncbi:MAG: apolipoprotein N-acyltransferase, partial [Gammaproteobacteria bacterium]|nr:apolipoprotein N-acyltransferase [Gammaproteobacteria bacterium]